MEVTVERAKRQRRTHDAEFKARAVAATRQPGVSLAAAAMANGINANLLRRWVVVTDALRTVAIRDTASRSPQRPLGDSEREFARGRPVAATTAFQTFAKRRQGRFKKRSELQDHRT